MKHAESNIEYLTKLHGIDTLIRDYFVIFFAKVLCCFEVDRSKMLFDEHLAENFDVKKGEKKLHFEDSYKLFKDYDEFYIDMLLEAVECSIFEFFKEIYFINIFSDIILCVYSSVTVGFVLSRSDNKKKSLHTTEILKNKKLNKLQSLLCDTFEFISRFVDHAKQNKKSDLSVINPSIISKIFYFMGYEQPNQVRLCTGNIISALSEDENVSRHIVELFWKSFANCKKDNEYRNFSSWIDGLIETRFSYETPTQKKLVLDFFKTFLDFGNKIEKGALKIKFLELILSVAHKLCVDKNVVDDKLCGIFTAVFNLVMKWSTISKHSKFCYSFLLRIVTIISPEFYMLNHPKIFELVCKYIKCGDPEMLEIIADFIKKSALFGQTSINENLRKQLSGMLVPSLFNKVDKKPSLRFKEPNQVKGIINILTQIGMCDIDYFSYLINIFLGQNSEDSSLLKSICISSISTLSELYPDIIASKSSDLGFVLENIILYRNDIREDEIISAVKTFPLIHNNNDKDLAQVSQVLFGYTMSNNPNLSSASIKSLEDYISGFVSLTSNALIPMNFLKKLLDELYSFSIDEVKKKLILVERITSAFILCLSRGNNDPGVILQGKCSLTESDWVVFRINIDIDFFPLLFCTDKDVRLMVSKISLMFENKYIKELDKVCDKGIHYFLSQWLTDINMLDFDIVDHINLVLTKSSESSEIYFKKGFELLKYKRSMIKNLNSTKLFCMTCGLANCNPTAISDFFEEIYRNDDPQIMDISKALPFLDENIWCKLLLDLNQWKASSSTKHHAQYVYVYYLISKQKDFVRILQSNRKLSEIYERYLITFWKSTDIHAHEIATNERSLYILQVFTENSKDRLSRVLDNEKGSFRVFLQSLISLSDIQYAPEFTNTYVDTLLSTLDTLFRYYKFEDNEMFYNFYKWIVEIVATFSAKERCHILFVQLLSTILINNQFLLNVYFDCTLLHIDTVSSAFILAFASFFESKKGMFKDDNFKSIILRLIITHIRSNLLLSRSAIVKIICLSILDKRLIFVEGAPPSLPMPISPHKYISYMDYSDIFVDYIANYVSPRIIYNIIKFISENAQKFDQRLEEIFYEIKQFIPILVNECFYDRLITDLIVLFSYSNYRKFSVSCIIDEIWTIFFQTLKGKSNLDIMFIIKKIFDYTNTIDIKSNMMVSSTLAIDAMFQYFKNEVSLYLFSIFKTFSISLPENVCECFVLLNNNSNNDYENEEIIGYIFLNRVIHHIHEMDEFVSSFPENAHILLYVAIMLHQKKEYVVHSSSTLLEKILSMTTLLISDGTNNYSSNLSSLIYGDLVKGSNDCSIQYSFSNESRNDQMNFHENSTIKSLIAIFCNYYPSFKEKFIHIVFANMFRKPNTLNDSLTIVLSLVDDFTTKHVHLISLFLVYVLRTSSFYLYDTLIEIICHIIESGKITEDRIKEESVPLISLLLISLSLDLSKSLILRIIILIGDLFSYLSKYTCVNIISLNILKCIGNSKNDEYICSLILTYFTKGVSIADECFCKLIPAIYQVSSFFASSCGENNFILLLAYVMDYLHYSIVSSRNGEYFNKDIECETTEEFVDKISKVFCDEYYITFLLNFCCSILNNQYIIDMGIDTVILKFLSCLILRTEYSSSIHMMSKLAQQFYLFGITCDESIRRNISSVFKYIISHNSVEYKYYNPLSINIKVIETERLVYESNKIVMVESIDRSSLPTFTIPSFTKEEVYQQIEEVLTCINQKLSSVDNTTPNIQ